MGSRFLGSPRGLISMPCHLRCCTLLISMFLPGISTTCLFGLGSAVRNIPVAILQSEGPQEPEVPPGVMLGLLISKTAPEYPPLARQARIQGTVVLHAEISKSGDVVKTTLVSGHPMLASAAIRAVSQWKYIPYLLNGDPVAVQTTVKVNFVLEPAASGVAGDAPGGPTDSMIQGIISSTPVIGPNGTPLHPQQIPAATAQNLLISKLNPEYPSEAKKQRVEGEVVLSVIIDKNGDVYKVDSISGHPLLMPAAITAVKQWKYVPYTSNGQAVEVGTIVRINFSLPDGVPSHGGEPSVVPGGVPGGSPPAQSAVIGGILSSTPPITPHVAAPTRIRVSEGVTAGLLVTKVNPIYPPDARKTRIQGQVVLRVNIDKEGNVSKIEPVSGHELLIPAAMQAVQQWKYKPFLLNQQPVEVDTQIMVNFILSGD
jgi:TonB family protein